MTNKARSKGKPAPAVPSSAALRVTVGKDETLAQAMAGMALSPAFQACAISLRYLKRMTGDLDVNDLHQEVIRQAEIVKAGNLGAAEAMLFDQAISLQAIFTSFADRAAINAGEYLPAAETYLRLALKAQAQCRATLETLADIKNPQPTAFIRQQNIAANQQVNNGTVTNARAHAGESGNPTNELSAVTHEQRQRLDLGATPAAGAGDPAMAAVGKRDRT